MSEIDVTVRSATSPLAGVGVTVTDASGTPVARAASDASGHIAFGLAAGDYLVYGDDMTGFVRANVDASAVTLTPGLHAPVSIAYKAGH
jgi:hypothetical protein